MRGRIVKQPQKERLVNYCSAIETQRESIALLYYFSTLFSHFFTQLEHL